jgi:1-acyl-sn-glycerol-3-phosphate acyltransferase
VGKTLNGIPLRRNGDFRDSLHRAEEMLNAGGILLIYPEGTRTKDGTVHAFHEGFAYLAKSTHADVLPVKLEGAFDVWPFNKQASFFTKRSVKVTFYPAFHPDSYSAHELTEAVQNIYIK